MGDDGPTGDGPTGDGATGDGPAGDGPNGGGPNGGGVAWKQRRVGEADKSDVSAVNAANVPEVGPMDEARLALFRDVAPFFDVIEHEGVVAGIFVGLAEGIDYASPNYRWFAQRHNRFAYVDRIALQPAARGRGIAVAVYDRFAAWAQETGRGVVCAEVNVIPPNPRSMRFHERQGFSVVDEISPYGGEERVAMVERRLVP